MLERVNRKKREKKRWEIFLLCLFTKIIRVCSGFIRERVDKRLSEDDKTFGLSNCHYEEVYLHDYGTVSEAKQGIGNYIAFYNQERPHQSLNYKTPTEMYFDSNNQNKRPNCILNMANSCLDNGIHLIILYLDTDMILSKKVVEECINECENEDCVALHTSERIVNLSSSQLSNLCNRTLNLYNQNFGTKIRDFERSFTMLLVLMQ